MLAHSSQNVILILGCQRSGTTLLKMLFGAHPDISILDHDEFETDRWHAEKDRLNKEQLVDLALQKASLGSCCIKAPQWCWNPIWIRRVLPNAKIVWIYRNPVEVVSSMLSLRVRNLPWVECWDSGEGLRNNAKVPGTGWSKCTNIWLKKNRQLKYHEPTAVVDYHDLCSNPEPMLKSLCQSLNIVYHPNMLKHTEFETDQKPIGGYDHKRPIDTNEKQLDPELIAKVEPLTEQLYDSLRSIRLTADCEAYQSKPSTSKVSIRPQSQVQN